MNIQELIENMNPQMLNSALNQISSKLTPSQRKSMEQAIKEVDTEEVKKKLSGMSFDDIKKELNKNPNMIKSLSHDEELVNKINNIISQK